MLTAIIISSVEAIEVNPSKERLQPQRGIRPYLFRGDPRKLERANTVDSRDVAVELKILTEPVSYRHFLDVELIIFNQSRRPIMMLFPDTRRIRVTLLDDKNEEVLLSSPERAQPIPGTVVINQRERAVFRSRVYFPPGSRVKPGIYTLKCSITSYPYIFATREIYIK